VLEAIQPEGRVSAHLDNNRKSEFDTSEHRHLDHGYAVTSHSSQGLTAEPVLDCPRSRRYQLSTRTC
jgi:ATP-dependent exoDNAse (exonuclease V) alpha subunit